MNSSEFQDIAL